MSPDVEAQLAQLRDIRLPDALGWWPLAPGWWLLLALLCLAILGGFAYDAWRKHTARYRALRELDALPTDDLQSFATEVSMLLRRVARRKDAYAAALSGSNWAAYLSERGLNQDLATYLVEATYAAQPRTALAQTTLRDAAAQWIRRQS